MFLLLQFWFVPAWLAPERMTQPWTLSLSSKKPLGRWLCFPGHHGCSSLSQFLVAALVVNEWKGRNGNKGRNWLVFCEGGQPAC